MAINFLKSSIIRATVYRPCQHADKIIVMERGRIVQMGRFKELATLPGVFRELAKRQAVE